MHAFLHLDISACLLFTSRGFSFPGSSSGNLSVTVWEEFVRCLGCSLDTASSGADVIEALDTCRELPEQAMIQQLSSKQLEESVRLLSGYLSSERALSEAGVKHGLYTNWKAYVKPVAQLMRGLMVSCVNTAVRDLNADAVHPLTGTRVLSHNYAHSNALTCMT